MPSIPLFSPNHKGAETQGKNFAHRNTWQKEAPAGSAGGESLSKKADAFSAKGDSLRSAPRDR